MRLAICTLSAVLLSGCSWLGGINNVFGGHGAQGAYGPHAQQAGHYGGAVKYGHAARGAQAQQYGQNFGGGFPQQPQFGAPQEVTGAYGTHAANAHQAYGNQRRTPKMRKPRLRGSLSLGFDKSISGDLLSGSNGSQVDLNPYGFRQENGFSGSPTEGLTIESDLRAFPTSVRAPSISFDDVHSAPMRIAGGAEFIVSPKTTVFANLGYTTAEGNEGGSVDIIGRVIGDPDLTDAERLASGIDATGIIFKGYRQNSLSGITTLGRDVEDLPIAQLAYDFSDLERLDFEVGGRHYLNPILRGNTARAITPFVGASVGAAHYNGLSYKAERQNLDLHEAVADTETSIEYIPQRNSDDPIEVYDSQWVATGQLNAGLEWQATPKTAIAFETGVKFESAREYSNGEKGDSNVSVPFTIRGSYNF
jgi:hypothetical protein